MTDRLVLDIGGVVCEVNLPHPEWYAPLAARYAPFLTSTDPDWHVDLRLGPAASDNGVTVLEHTASVTSFRFEAYTGVIDLVNQQATVSAPDEASADLVVERVLAFICMQILPRQHRALWLHAAGLVFNGLGYVFFGPSMAGKTTLARLARDRAEILSDENVIVRYGANGPQLISTPFWGHRTPLEAIQRTRRTVPLRALFALQHTPDFRVRPMSMAEAVLALLATRTVPAERVDSASAWLSTVEQLVQQAPVYELGFVPTPEVWSFLEQHGLMHL